jgi:hypothetical protein
MSSPFEFSHIFQVYTLNLIENLQGGLKGLGRACTLVKFYLKMQKLQAGDHLQQDVEF